MGAAVAVALAVGIGTTGVRSNTTYKKPTQIIAAAKTTTLTDYHSNTEFTKSSDVKNYICNANPNGFEPMNANFGIMADLEFKHKKKERKALYGKVALEQMEKEVEKLND